MDNTIWTYTLFIALALFITMYILIKVFHFNRPKYQFEYHEDEVVKTNTMHQYKNTYYLADEETYKYIKRYVIRRSAYDTSVVCNYNTEYNQIEFFVVAYNKKHKVISVLRVEEMKTTNSSKIISLPKNTDDVNIIVGKINGKTINSSITLDVPTGRLRIHTLLSSVRFFSFLYMIRHLTVYLTFLLTKNSEYMRKFFETEWNLYSIAIIALGTVLFGLVMILRLKKKNRANKTGGALEYEFY